MPIKSYFEKKNSDLIKQFMKKGFSKNSVVSQNIKKRLFYFSLRIETHNYRRVAIFEIPKKFKITPPQYGGLQLPHMHHIVVPNVYLPTLRTRISNLSTIAKIISLKSPDAHARCYQHRNATNVGVKLVKIGPTEQLNLRIINGTLSSSKLRT